VQKAFFQRSGAGCLRHHRGGYSYVSEQRFSPAQAVTYATGAVKLSKVVAGMQKANTDLIFVTEQKNFAFPATLDLRNKALQAAGTPPSPQSNVPGGENAMKITNAFVIVLSARFAREVSVTPAPCTSTALKPYCLSCGSHQCGLFCRSNWPPMPRARRLAISQSFSPVDAARYPCFNLLPYGSVAAVQTRTRRATNSGGLQCRGGDPPTVSSVARS